MGDLIIVKDANPIFITHCVRAAARQRLAEAEAGAGAGTEGEVDTEEEVGLLYSKEPEHNNNINVEVYRHYNINNNNNMDNVQTTLHWRCLHRHNQLTLITLESLLMLQQWQIEAQQCIRMSIPKISTLMGQKSEQLFLSRNG